MSATTPAPHRGDPHRPFLCAWCDRPWTAPTAAPHARFCSTRCRQASWRFTELRRERIRATQPLALAYADPPYPGTAKRYYRHHPAYAGEVDHVALLEQLRAFDGWALSTSAAALPSVLAIATRLDLAPRVAAWFRGARPTRSAWPLTTWEPVVYAGGRRAPSNAAARDALIYTSRPRLTDPKRVTGTKPAAFAWWLFHLLGAAPGDTLADLFPGSGGITRAWASFNAPSNPRAA